MLILYSIRISVYYKKLWADYNVMKVMVEYSYNTTGYYKKWRANYKAMKMMDEYFSISVFF